MPYDSNNLNIDLAGRLGLDVETAGRWLRAFSSAMALELLASGRIFVRGLGLFAIDHCPSSRKATAAGALHTPPRNKVIYSRPRFGADATLRLALSVQGVEKDEAALFARTIGELFAQFLKAGDPVVLEGFGCCRVEGPLCRFEPDDAFALLVNRQYGTLSDVVLKQRASVHSGSYPPARFPRFTLAVVLLLLAVGAGFFFLAGSPAFRIAGQGTAAAPVEPYPAARRVAAEVPVLMKSQVGVILEKGEYTLILATFLGKRSAEAEQQRLAGLGIVTTLWPAWSGGRQYLRLRTGRYPDRREAEAGLSALPEGVASQAYIQQAQKNVVVHGEM